MKSEAIVELGKPLQTIESETPEPKGKEVLLKITHSGVCHSDVHIHDGYFDLGGGNKLPVGEMLNLPHTCLLYTSPSPRDGLLSRMPSSA